MSDVFLGGERYFENYKKYYCSGERKLAEINFLKAVDMFQRSDEVCSVSSLYIGKFILEEDNTSLEIARRYAILDNCKKELNAIDFLTGKNFTYDALPVTLQIQSQNFKSAGSVIDRLSEDDLDDISRSRLSRYFAEKFLQQNSPDEASQLVDYAIEIDRFGGLTYNLKLDLLIKKKICGLKHTDCSLIDERLSIIETKLNKK
jgi:hypothetical protein